MYLTDVLIHNSGALEKLILKFPFNADGSPLPLLLVGANGSGKTAFLSIIADSLIEIAAKGFQNVTPAQGFGREFFRVLGGRSVRVSSPYELAALRFKHGDQDLHYRSKAGSIDPGTLSAEMEIFLPVANWPTNRLLKKSFATALQDRVIAVVKG